MSKFEVLAGADKIFCDTLFSSFKIAFLVVRIVPNWIFLAAARGRQLGASPITELFGQSDSSTTPMW